MREILFRGKDLKTGRWKYGDYARVQNPFSEDGLPLKHLICDGVNAFNPEVISETVGQFTGMTDKDGKKIFEGDIVKFDDCGEEGYEYKEGFDFVNAGKVIWNNGRWELDDFISLNSGVAEEMSSCHEDFTTVFSVCEVIGNIHDNPELLEADHA